LVEVWLPYGTSEIPARIPAERLVDILRPEKQSGIQEYVTEVKKAIESDETLSRAASESKRTCIALGACGSQQLMVELSRLVLEFLAGKSNCPVVVLRTQDAPKLDSGVFGQARFVNHNPLSSENVPLPAFGVFPLQLNSEFVNADLKIVLGELKPNHLLKFEGVTDIVLPGLASAASVTSHLSDRQGLVMGDLYKERVQVGISVENLFVLGLVLADDLTPAQITCGPFAQCLENLEKGVVDTFTRDFSKRADIVVIGSGGKPTDDSLVRAVETLPAGVGALKKNGSLILAAECEDGHGDGEFYEWSAEGKEARYLDARLRRRLNYNGFKASLLRRTLDAHRVYLVSTIPDHYVENVFKMRAARTINAALQTVQRVQGSDATISVIPNGSRVIPKLTEPQR
jgi:nickel-dependent lactate racemase